MFVRRAEKENTDDAVIMFASLVANVKTNCTFTLKCPADFKSEVPTKNNTRVK